ncbi:MAG: peptide deformylase [Chloroflexota bacterium]
MAVRPILTSENPLLRERSKKLRQFGAALAELVDDMFETMHAANGLGLAAPQIGVLQRVFVVSVPAELDDDGKEIEPACDYVLVNPEIVKASDPEEMEEGCLSVPGYRGLVTRATQVTIKGQDVRGHEVRYRAEELLAQAFQHELDHLDGVLYLDHLEGPDKFWRLEPEGEPQVARAE